MRKNLSLLVFSGLLNSVTSLCLASALVVGETQDSAVQQSVASLKANSRQGNTRSFDSAGRVARIQAPKGNYLDLDYDGLGRINSLHSSNGNIWQFKYEGHNSWTPSRILLNGERWTPPASTSQHNKVWEYDEDYWTMFYEFRDRLDSFSCMYCLDLVGDLANWLGIGTAFGTFVGGWIAVASGATLEQILLLAGLGGFTGLSAVFVFAGGYLIGTLIYDSLGTVVWTNIP